MIDQWSFLYYLINISKIYQVFKSTKESRDFCRNHLLNKHYLHSEKNDEKSEDSETKKAEQEECEPHKITNLSFIIHFRTKKRVPRLILFGTEGLLDKCFSEISPDQKNRGQHNLFVIPKYKDNGICKNNWYYAGGTE